LTSEPNGISFVHPNMADDSLKPIQILIDDLKHEDVQSRLNSVKRLGTIARALGPEGTRESLINFITESLDDEDEVLIVLAEILGDFIEEVGGVEHAHVLLKPLENLASTEDSSVREKSVQSLNKISTSLSDAHVTDYMFPLVKRLVNGDWFTSKASAAALFAPIYKRVNSERQSELVALYRILIEDKTPVVRRNAGASLGDFIRVMPAEIVLKEGMQLFQKVYDDEQDNVRLQAASVAVAMGEVLDDENREKLVLPYILQCATDSAWRVRYMAAELFCKLSAVCGEKVTRDKLITEYCNLLGDAEPEVRTAAATKVCGVCEYLTPDEIVQKILPCTKELVVDDSQHVRAALAGEIMGIAPKLGREYTIQHLQEFFLTLLKDEFPDVRLNIISKLDAVHKVIGIELLSQSLLPAIVQLAEDRQWRVRLAIIEYIPLLAKQLGVQFFDEKLSELCMTLLGDPVFSVREAATKNHRKLIEVFGVEWGQNNIIPKVLNLYSHPNYLYRLTILFSIQSLSPAVGGEVLQESMLPLVLRMAQDAVPNIRFNVARTLREMILVLDPRVTEERIKPVLLELAKDRDVDVQFFTHQALAAIG